MAREEHEREDMLAEATAFVERAEVTLVDGGGAVFFGFRHDGAASVYFGGEPVYHFNSRGELRRAFVDGAIIKAEGGRLVRLRRERPCGSVRLMRYELTDQELHQFLSQLHEKFNILRTALMSARFTLVGRFPKDSPVVARFTTWIADREGGIGVAAVANV